MTEQNLVGVQLGLRDTPGDRSWFRRRSVTMFTINVNPTDSGCDFTELNWCTSVESKPSDYKGS